VIGPGVQRPVVTKGLNEIFTGCKIADLPGALVAGQYFMKKLEFGDFTLECFARDTSWKPWEKAPRRRRKFWNFIRKRYGSSASGNHYRLVEVDEPLSRQPGMLAPFSLPAVNLRRPHRRCANSRAGSPINGGRRRWECRARKISGSWTGWRIFPPLIFGQKRRSGRVSQEEIDNLAVLALKFEGKSAVRRAWIWDTGRKDTSPWWREKARGS